MRRAPDTLPRSLPQLVDPVSGPGVWSQRGKLSSFSSNLHRRGALCLPPTPPPGSETPERLFDSRVAFTGVCRRRALGSVVGVSEVGFVSGVFPDVHHGGPL